MASLGRLERVDLRSVWFNEAGDFTPWLAEEDNLLLLGETIGLELELESTEKNVGPFRADILCKDTLTDSWVLVENQLERTDHSHLGQLLTYAAGLDAVTIVWIAQRFADEHRAALNWLNEVTTEDINFFGLEIELWRIGESYIAPKFNVISQPNDWTKSVVAVRTSGELSETQQLHLQYWTAFRNTIEEHSKIITQVRKPSSKYWMDFAIGRSSFVLATRNGMRDGYIAVELIIKSEHALNYFYQLAEDRAAIEESIGYSLIWENTGGRRQQKIVLLREGVDTTNPNNWSEYHAWQLDLLERFYQTFRPRIMALNADDYVIETDEPL